MVLLKTRRKEADGLGERMARRVGWTAGGAALAFVAAAGTVQIIGTRVRSLISRCGPSSPTGPSDRRDLSAQHSFLPKGNQMERGEGANRNNGESNHAEAAKKIREREEEEEPQNEEDELERATQAGARNYPKKLWSRLNNPDPDRPTIDVWEIKSENDYVAMTFIVDGERFHMYFSERSRNDYQMLSNTWIPRSKMYSALRSRIYSLPKILSINKLVIFNTPECEAEDCLIELFFIKKWKCKQLDYTIASEFTQPQHLRKLVHMFKPAEIIIFLNFGPYQCSSGNAPETGMHNHLAAVADGTVEIERDFRIDCAQALNSADPSRHDASHLYGEAGRGRMFGQQMVRTLNALKQFVSLMVERKMTMGQAGSWEIKKFMVNGPTNDKMCPKLQALFKDDGIEESNRKRQAYASGEKVYVCVRQQLHRHLKYSLSMPATAFKMAIGNHELLHFTKVVPNFHCLFRTNVDEHGVRTLIQEWLKGERYIEEIQIHVDKVFEPNFADSFVPEHNDPKRIKIRRCLNERRSTLYIERERLTTRHLSLRVLDAK
ncbi:unnamed protein product [Caenorhabditis sp. 36 PRJEB53466]|nr:unnamed protein product [Caenorhabditis sp. 36 PRJEB53466]